MTSTDTTAGTVQYNAVQTLVQYSTVQIRLQEDVLEDDHRAQLPGRAGAGHGLPPLCRLRSHLPQHVPRRREGDQVSTS